MMIDLGMASMINNDLVLTGFKKLIVRTGNTVEIKVNCSLQEIIREILFTHVKVDYDRQKFMSDLVPGRKKSNYRAFIKAYKKYGRKSRSQEKIITSYRRIAKQCNISISSAHTLVNTTLKGRVKLITQQEVVRTEYSEGFRPIVTDNGLLKKIGANIVLISGSELRVTG
jgi:hypothetical protein